MLVMEAITVAEMREYEESRIRNGTSVLELMEQAGKGAAEIIIRKLGTGNRITVVCGPGNNGGDGYVCARYLRKENRVNIVEAGAPMTREAAENREKVVELISGGIDGDIVVDAMLGIGSRKPLRGRIREICRMLRGKKVISIDVPTGVDADSGEADDYAVMPYATISVHMPKTGVLKYGKAGLMWTIEI